MWVISHVTHNNTTKMEPADQITNSEYEQNVIDIRQRIMIDRMRSNTILTWSERHRQNVSVDSSIKETPAFQHAIIVRQKRATCTTCRQMYLWEACEKTNNPIFSLKLERGGRRNDAIIYRCNPSTTRSHTIHHHPSERGVSSCCTHYTDVVFVATLPTISPCWHDECTAMKCNAKYAFSVEKCYMHQLMWINRLCWPNFSRSQPSQSAACRWNATSKAHKINPQQRVYGIFSAFFYIPYLLQTWFCARHGTKHTHKISQNQHPHTHCESIHNCFFGFFRRSGKSNVGSCHNDMCPMLACICVSIALRALFV